MFSISFCLHWHFLLLLLFLSGAYIFNLCLFSFVRCFFKKFCAKAIQMQCTVSSKGIEEKCLCLRRCWQRLNRTEVESLKIHVERKGCWKPTFPKSWPLEQWPQSTFSPTGENICLCAVESEEDWACAVVLCVKRWLSCHFRVHVFKEAQCWNFRTI